MTLLVWAALVGTTFIAALLYIISGFGFAVLVVPLYLLLLDRAQAVQLAVILSTGLSFAVVPGLRRTVAPTLLLRLTVGSLLGLPVGLYSFRYADPLLVRLGVGATILAFALLIAGSRREGGRLPVAFGRTRGRDLGAGAVAGMATALVGMPGPPVLIYLLLAGTAGQTVRATLLAFFCAVLHRDGRVPCCNHRDSGRHLGHRRSPRSRRLARRGRRKADRRPPGRRRFYPADDRAAHRRRALHHSGRRSRARYPSTMSIRAGGKEISKSQC